jgi:hypothetical protein
MSRLSMELESRAVITVQTETLSDCKQT